MVFQEPSQSQIVRQRERLESTLTHESENLSVSGLDLRREVPEDLSPLEGWNCRNRGIDPSLLQLRESQASGFELREDEVRKDERGDGGESGELADFVEM